MGDREDLCGGDDGEVLDGEEGVEDVEDESPVRESQGSR